MAEDAKEKLKQIKLKSAQKLVGELDTIELEDFTMGVELELSKRESLDKPTWNHITDYSEDIQRAIHAWKRVSGISTGLPSLDRVIGGLRKGQTTLFAGASNAGKSAITAQIAVNVAKHHKVGYISLEMLPGDNGARINHMNGGNIENLDIYFQSTTQIDYKHLDHLFKQAKDQGFELVLLDYLQFLGRDLSQDEVAKMSKTIKQVAMKYEIPLIVIVSLRKGDGKRKWTDIEVEDLMGTSAIGYDADNVLVVSRSDMAGEFDDEHLFLKVLKLRNMPKTKDNEFLWYDWEDTRVTEAPVPLHLMNPEEGELTDDGRIVYKPQQNKLDRNGQV